VIGLAIERVARGPSRPGQRYTLQLVPDAPSDQWTFEDLHKRFGRDLHHFVARRMRDADLVDDIVQETFLRAYRARASFDTNRPPWPWLATIARNLILNAFRDDERARDHLQPAAAWQELEGQADARDEIDPEQRYVAGQRRDAIATALDSLPPRHRRLLLMQSVEHLGYKEIAQAEGLSVDAMKSVLKRARRTFRQAYRSIADEHGIPSVVVFLRTLRLRCRTAYERIQDRTWSALTRVEHIHPLFGSFMEVLVTAGVVGAMLLGSLPSHSGGERSTTQPVERLSEASSVAGTSSSVPQRRPGSDLVTRTAEGPGSAVAVRGGVDRERRDRRTIHVAIDYDVPGTDMTSEELSVDVPCDVTPHPTDVCGTADAVTPDD
jgi:RNA polymerase sigma-70 factor (ECF subfamily)